MSGYSRQHRPSWHVGYTPSVNISSTTLSSTPSRYTTSDYSSRYGTSGYRRHSAIDKYGASSTGDYSSKYGYTSSDYKYGLGDSTTSSSGHYRRYSSSTDYNRRYDPGSDYDKADYDKYKSSESRRQSIDATSTDSRRNSACDYDKTLGESRSSRARRTSAVDQVPDGSCHDGKRDDKREGAESGVTSSVSEKESSNLPVLKRKTSVENRTSIGLDYNKVFNDDDTSRPRTYKGTNGLKSGQPPDVVSTSARGSRAQEVARLESLCEARTKQLTLTSMQLKGSLQAFDAMACLLNYCANELDAFACPLISARLQTAQNKLAEQQQCLDGLQQHKVQAEQQLQEVRSAMDAAQQEVTNLQQQLQAAREAHMTDQQHLLEQQTSAWNTERGELTAQHQHTLQQMQKYQEKQAEYTRHAHKRQISELAAEHEMATSQLKLAHLEDTQKLHNKHELQIEELHAQHRKKLEDITDRFESIKLSLTEKVQSLCTECDDLRVRTKNSEDALQRDADVKVQLALTPYLQLPKEIESLKTVIDMRTEEIQKLRRQNMDLVKQLEELPIAQEKVVSLKQKVENLQAIINIKTDHEKKLHEKCQLLMRKYDRESKANKRLSMDYEQVMWRMSQSADFTGSMESVSPRQLSRSPSRGSQHSHGSSPVRSLSSSSQGGDMTRRSRKTSGGEEDADHRRRANTFSSDTNRHKRTKSDLGTNGCGPGGAGKQRVVSKSGDYSELVKDAREQEESFSSGHESGDTDLYSSLDSNVILESSLILETAQGVSFHVIDKVACDGTPSQDEVFTEDTLRQSLKDSLLADSSLPEEALNSHTDVTVVVSSPTSNV